MEIINSVKKCKKLSDNARLDKFTIGLVPTMGFLHEGHLSLIRKARKECGMVFVSVFVNPTQFRPGEDYEKYPRDLKRDIKLSEEEGVDCFFNPSVKEMYGDNHKTFVTVEKLENIMCGACRPGHFRGVATVVLKLFNIVNPHIAYFGMKDYQQLLIIKKMTEDLNIGIEIRGMPIIREKDGLAMSSRNKYLTTEERKDAPVLYNILKKSKDLILAGEKNTAKIKDLLSNEIKNNKSAKSIDYFDFRDARTLREINNIVKEDNEILIAAAVYFGSTRLIDNIIIKLK